LTSDAIFFDGTIEIFVPSEYPLAIWCKSFLVVLLEKQASNCERRIGSGVGGTVLVLIISHKMWMWSSRAFYII